MRALEFITVDDREINLYRTDQKIGQNAFRSPSVFNYYLAEYSPPGALGKLGLVAPEAQIMTAPTSISFLNAMSVMIQDGQSVNNGGLSSPHRGREAEGYFFFKPTTPSDPEVVVDELSMLLTEGRLSKESKAIIAEEYANFPKDVRFVYSTGTNANRGINGDDGNADSLKADDDESRVELKAGQ